MLVYQRVTIFPFFWDLFVSTLGFCGGVFFSSTSFWELTTHLELSPYGYSTYSYGESPCYPGWWLTYTSEKWWSESQLGCYSIPNCFWKVIKFHGSSQHQAVIFYPFWIGLYSKANHPETDHFPLPTCDILWPEIPGQVHQGIFKQHQVHGLLFRENALIWRFFLWDFLWENGHVDLQIFRWEPWDFPGFFRWNRGISWDFMWTYYEHGGFQWNFRPLRNCEETIIIPTKSGIAQRVPCETFL